MVLVIVLLSGAVLGLGLGCIMLLTRNQDKQIDLWVAQDRITVLESALQSARKETVTLAKHVDILEQKCGVLVFDPDLTGIKVNLDLHKELNHE